MDVQCPKCHQTVIIRKELGESEKLVVHCPTCETAFIVKRKARHAGVEESAVGETQPRPPLLSGSTWHIKKADGTILSFQSIRTLQTWVIAGVVSVEDHISRKGVQWRRIGALPELASFIEKTRKLHDETPAINLPSAAAPPGPEVSGEAIDDIEEADSGGSFVPVPVPEPVEPIAPAPRPPTAAWTGDEVPTVGDEEGDDEARGGGLLAAAALLGVVVGLVLLWHFGLWDQGCEGRPVRHEAPVATAAKATPPAPEEPKTVRPAPTKPKTLLTSPARPNPVPAPPTRDTGKGKPAEGTKPADSLSPEAKPADAKPPEAMPETKKPEPAAKPEPKKPEPKKPEPAAKKPAPTKPEKKPAARPRPAKKPEPKPSEDAEGYDQIMDEANKAFRASPSRAARLYLKASRRDPSLVEPIAQLGWCYLRMGNIKWAFEYFRKAVRMNPRYTDSYRGLGEAYRRSGDKSSACKEYRRYEGMLRPGSSRAERARAKIEELGCP